MQIPLFNLYHSPPYPHRYPGLSVTAVGARRGLLVGLPSVEEDVGLIGVHHEGQFIELTPWVGDVDWDVEPWGKWWVHLMTAVFVVVCV